MIIEKHEIDVATTDGSGSAYTDAPVVGRVTQISYTPDGTSPYDASFDVAITGEKTSLNILTQAGITGAFQVKPSQACPLNTDGSALTYDGSHAVNDDLVVSSEKILISVTNAGAGLRTGKFYIWIDR